MSVINKMLRDLDRRQAAGTIPVPTGESRTHMARGTLIVNDSDRAGRRRVSLPVAVLMAVMVLGGAAGAWWYLTHNQLAQRKVDQVRLAPTPTPTPASGMPVTVVAPAAAPSVQQKEVAPVTVAAPAPALVDPAPVPQKTANVAPPVTAKLPVVESGARADVSLKLDSRLKAVPTADTAVKLPTPASVSVPVPAVVAGMPQPVPERSLSEPPVKERPMTSASTVAATAAAMAVPPSPSRQSPALEALAQAQSLWNSGSHDAAIELVREALAAAERGNLAGTSAGNNSVLAALARELARMDLAEGRVSQALELLTRLEPALSGAADVWALRGNAAQRLGRHSESAAAYLMALKLRPNEARWMLGAAVSLAAQGQTAEAAELAEKARAGGVLSREVATYLRQLGVPLRER